MTAARLRWWSWTHTWSSLICTIFALLLCLTGLPLIFHDELGPNPALETGTDRGVRASVDAMIAQALAERPGEIVPYLFYDRNKPIVKIPIAASVTSSPDTFFYKVFDVRTGTALGIDQPNQGFMYVMLRLHADLFAGLKGTLFLGAMGLLLARSGPAWRSTARSRGAGASATYASDRAGACDGWICTMCSASSPWPGSAS
jgi:uncharacterized iron-regulated membrane protein